MNICFLLSLSLSLYSIFGSSSIFSMQQTQQDIKAPKSLLQLCLKAIELNKNNLQTKIDDYTSKTIANVISIYYKYKMLSNYEYLNLLDLCTTEDEVSTDVIKSVQESSRSGSIKGKIQFFEKVPKLSMKTQRKIMANNQETGPSAI